MLVDVRASVSTHICTRPFGIANSEREVRSTGLGAQSWSPLLTWNSKERENSRYESFWTSRLL